MQWFYFLPSPVQALFASLFTYGMTALGAAMIFLSKRLKNGTITLMTGVSAGIMISAGFFSLLLPATECESDIPVFIPVSVGFLLGGAFITLSDLVLDGVNFKPEVKKSALLYGAVTLHNVPEGMAIGTAFACVATGDVSGVVTALLFALGVGIQNFPEGVCVAYSLKGEGVGIKRSFFLSQLSGFVEVVSAVLGAFMLRFSKGAMPYVLSFSAGAMIAVVCSELIPEAFGNNKRLASVGVIVGFALMMLLDLAF